MTLKILSWNIWIYADTKEIERFLATTDADIIGLQEVQEDKPDRDTIGFMKNLGYKHVFAPAEKEWGGQVWRDGPAVFTKHDIVGADAVILSKPEQRAVARADIKAGDTTVHVFSTHLIHTHQKPSELQERQVDALCALLPKEHVIVMGDFNATPESAAIKKMTAVLRDTDPTSQPTWSVYPEGCEGCKPEAIDTRLDYIFVSPDVRSRSFKVEQSRASDHLPISVEIEI